MTRRSAHVGFTVLSLSAALAACGEGTAGDPNAKETPVYASVADCQKANPGLDCATAQRQAELEHLSTAPVSANRADCEKQWGDGHCEERPSDRGGSVFIPVLAGFMLGRALSGPGYAQPGCPPGDPRCSSGSSGFTSSHGVYVGRTGGLFSGGQKVGDAEMRDGQWRAPSRAFVSEGANGRVASARVSRGGFGRFGGFHFGGGRGG